MFLTREITRGTIPWREQVRDHSCFLERERDREFLKYRENRIETLLKPSTLCFCNDQRLNSSKLVLMVSLILFVTLPLILFLSLSLSHSYSHSHTLWDGGLGVGGGGISIMGTNAENFRGVRLGPIDRGPQRSGERESLCGQMSDRSKDGEGEKPRVSEQKGSMQPQVT